MQQADAVYAAIAGRLRGLRQNGVLAHLHRQVLSDAPCGLAKLDQRHRRSSPFGVTSVWLQRAPYEFCGAVEACLIAAIARRGRKA